MDWKTLATAAADPFRLAPRDGGPSHRLTRALFVRGLGAVNAIAFLSLWVQIEGLSGSAGIVPAGPLVRRAFELTGYQGALVAPSLFWLVPTDGTLHALCAGGLAASLLVTAGVLQGPLLLAAFVAYLSLQSVCQPFLGFQWDALLCEANVLGALVGPWTLWSRGAPDPMPLAISLVRWLYFRLMFFAGYVKLASGDPAWRDRTALDVHFWTQPLPNPLSWYAAQLPHGVQQLGVVAMFACELVLPWAFLVGGRVGVVVFASACALMGALQLTGNYGFFQLLTVVIAATLLDDAAIRRALPSRWARGLDSAEGGGGRLAELGSWIRGVVAALLLGLSVLRVWGQVAGWPAVPEAARSVVKITAPFHVVNGYGLFAVMTKGRPEVEIQGSRDGVTWVPYRFRYKPEPGRAPPVVAPHMPRLDWQMWFLPKYGADGRVLPDAWQGCERDPWVMHLLERLLDGSPAVLGLLDGDPFGGRPPAYVRAQMWDQRFGPPGSRVWWERDRERGYCAVMSREENL